MEQIIARQNSAAKPATGKTFVIGIAKVIVELAIAQVVVNFLIRATGMGLLNLLFYLYAVMLLVRFMTRTVAGTIYTLKQDTLVLQRLLGDSTVLGVEIPLSAIVSIRPLLCGQRLHTDYRQVTYVDSSCAPGLRMRLAFGASLIFAGLARVIAGKKAYQENGYVVVYMEEGKRRACAFKPDLQFRAALWATLPDVSDADERLARPKNERYGAMSLRRAFGAKLYPHVADAVTKEEEDFAREEFARRKAARKVFFRRMKTKIAKALGFKTRNVELAENAAKPQPDSEAAQADPKEETAAKESDNHAPRRRRGRQE